MTFDENMFWISCCTWGN